MTYADFVAAVAANAGVSKVKTKNVVDATVKTLIDLVSEGEEITLYGLGKFTTRVTGERRCHNFVTGEIMTVPEHKRPVFKFTNDIRKNVKELDV